MNLIDFSRNFRCIWEGCLHGDSESLKKHLTFVSLCFDTKKFLIIFILICIIHVRCFSNLDFQFFVALGQKTLKFIKCFFLEIYVQFHPVNVYAVCTS